MNGECCGSREEGQANDIPATLVVVYYTSQTCLLINGSPFFQIFTMFTDPITEKTVYAYLVVHFKI